MVQQQKQQQQQQKRRPMGRSLAACSRLAGLVLVLLLEQQHRVAQASHLGHQSQAQQQQQMQSYHQQSAASSNALMQQQQEQLMQQQQQPTIIPFSFNQNVQENQRAVVMCTTASGEMPLSFSWLKDGQPLTPQVAQARRIQVKSDQDSSTLKISLVRLEHAGNYTCMAKNPYGSHLHTAQLIVLGEPRWLNKEPPHNEPIVTTRGQTIVIDCQTIGYPRPQQTWHIKTHTPGSELEPLAASVGANGRVSLAANGSLVIRNADKADEANYVCKSSNGIGRGISWGTSLKVTVPAHFDAAAKQQQQASVVRKSSQVQLRCDAYGDQPITIEWFKNKQPLLQQQQQQQQQVGQVDGPILVAGDPRYSIHSNNNPLKNGLISQLLIKQAQRGDNSIYECVTRNPHGRDRLAMELVVQEEPDSIQELQLSQVSSRSVTLMWNEPYDGRSPITSYMFQYKRVAGAVEPALLNELSDLIADSDQLISAAGLHHHQAQQQQQQQQQYHGGLKPTATALDSDWQHANRIVLPQRQLESASHGVDGRGSVRSITIEKLEPSSKYVLRALAINAIGQSKFSQPMEFSTDEEAPEVGPVNIRAEALNSTSIQVSWDEIPRSRHQGRIQGYYIGYRVANNNSAAANFIYKPYIINDLTTATAAAPQSVGTEQAAGPRLGTAIHDLRRDTTYEITVVAFNSRGSGPSSDFVVCKTIEMEAPKPVKLAIRRESNESIFIEWQRDPSDQNPVDDYVLYQEKNSASQEWLQVRLPGNQTQYKAPGLKCGTRYQFYISAHNKVGKSAPSEVVSASTSGALPVIPSKTSLIKMINSTCLLVNLNSFQDNGCRIKTFTVRYRVDKLNVPPASAEGQQALGQQQAAGQSASATGNSINANANTNANNGGGASGSSGQIVGSNGLSPSHQALTAASQLGGKTVLAGQTAGSSGAYASEWIAIRPKSNIKQQRANEEDRMEYLCDLSPVGEYTIHVAAANDVGRSEIEYSVLMSSDELRRSALKDLLELFSGLAGFFAYIPSMIVFLLAGILLSLVSLILYTTAMKYYQKFIIMQNQMRATRRAKADERRRRKLANSGANQSRHSQKMAELWAEEYEDELEDELEGEMEEDEDEASEEAAAARGPALAHGLDVDGDDEDDGTATDELQSTSSSSANSNAAIHRGRRPGAAALKQCQRVTGRALARHHSHLSPQALQQHQRQQQQQHQHHHLHQYSNSNLAQRTRHSHYLANISNSAFDSSSIDSPCNGKRPTNGSACLSDASTDSIPNHNGGRFQCLNSKQYVKMNEYSMLPTISASLSPVANDIYGTVAMRQQQAQQQQQQHQHSSVSPNHQHQYRLAGGSSPSGNSSSSASNHTSSTTTAGPNNSNSLYYSTLRRTNMTNMQTYLPQQRSRPAVGGQVTRGPGQNLSDIYGYYMAPQLQQQQQQQQQAQSQGPVESQSVQQQSTSQVRAQAQHAQAAAAAAAAAAQQAANEAANSIFVPPQQIIYSAPNIRRQPPVFL